MAAEDKVIEDVKKTTISYALDWGKSPLPPMVLATLVTALHARPFQFLPMTFTPVLLFSTYLNINGFEVDSAGITGAFSGLYLLLAQRRKTPGSGIAARLGNKFGTRGIIRGTTMGVAAANMVAGLATYGLTKREDVTDL